MVSGHLFAKLQIVSPPAGLLGFLHFSIYLISKTGSVAETVPVFTLTEVPRNIYSVSFGNKMSYPGLKKIPIKLRSTPRIEYSCIKNFL